VSFEDCFDHVDIIHFFADYFMLPSHGEIKKNILGQGLEYFTVHKARNGRIDLQADAK
jgi:hypothetical protein